MILVPPPRVERWVANFEERHGATTYAVATGALTGVAADGSTFEARLPFDEQYAGPATVRDFAAAVVVPDRWGLLLVRKGGFAVARLEGDRLVDSKVGRRHVQGRTKAGGQSQQRLARRRDNQARQAYQAAAGHAARILSGAGLLVAGGDRAAVDAVLADPGLRDVRLVGPWLPVPDPRRSVLEQAARDATSARVEVHNAEPAVG